MKLSLSSHRLAADYADRWLAEERDRLTRLNVEFKRQSDLQAHYRRQIQRAEREGRDGFDARSFKPDALVRTRDE